MGQKTNPTGFRIGITKPWMSRWFTKKDYAKWVHEDIKFRDLIMKRLDGMGIARIDIERASTKAKITIHTSRPGLVIGKKGTGIDGVKTELQTMTKNEVYLNIQEVRRAELDAKLVAENIAMQLERRIAFRRAMKKSVQTALKFGAKGIKVKCGGRLAGAEIARVEWYREGRVPLHTLRADIDYGTAEANTTYGIIGIKVWVYKGDVVIQ